MEELKKTFKIRVNPRSLATIRDTPIGYNFFVDPLDAICVYDDGIYLDLTADFVYTPPTILNYNKAKEGQENVLRVRRLDEHEKPDSFEIFFEEFFLKNRDFIFPVRRRDEFEIDDQVPITQFEFTRREMPGYMDVLETKNRGIKTENLSKVNIFVLENRLTYADEKQDFEASILIKKELERRVRSKK